MSPPVEREMLARRIEEASLRAWPALEQVVLDGWVLRFSRGYTKRANSINPYGDAGGDLEERVARCEERYRERRMPSIFRLTSFSARPGLDRLLERRGYRYIEPTLVLCRDLAAEPVREAGVELRGERLDDWLPLYCSFHGSAVGRHQTHREILETIPSGRLLASLRADGTAVACGMGVLDGELFGLFDLVTAPGQRNRGHGAEMVNGMLRWARERGATDAYLQVVASNAPALHLYGKLGFREAYRYAYQVPG